MTSVRGEEAHSSSRGNGVLECQRLHTFSNQSVFVGFRESPNAITPTSDVRTLASKRRPNVRAAFLLAGEDNPRLVDAPVRLR